MESKKINQLATELAPDLSDLTIIGDPTTGISKKITLSQMASLFTGTVEEYANFAAFPLVGVADTIYIAKDTNVIYRWDSTAYVVLSPNIIASLVFNDANGFDGTIALVGSVATLTITTALTTGSVPFIGASGALTQDNANLFFDDTNNRLGINTNAPTTALDVFGSGIIGRINGTSTNNAFLGFASAGTNKWSIGNVQSDHRFRIYNEATTSELVSVLSTGEFGIGIANPTTKVHIDGGSSALIANLDANVSVAKSISFRSDNSARINLEVSGSENGANTGAKFQIKRFSDAGVFIDTPFEISRETGNSTFSSNLLFLGKNQDGFTSFYIENTTGGTASGGSYIIRSDFGSDFAAFGKFSTLTSAIGIRSPKDAYLITDNGSIAILTSDATGTIKMAAGNSSTAHLTIASTGAATFSSSVTADFLVVGTTAASSGGLRLGTQVAIRARNVANNANIPLIESTATDAVAIASGGANVGIGTSDPQAPLHIIKALGSDVFAIGESGTNTRFAIGQEASYTGNYINSQNIDLKIQSYLSGGSGGTIIFQTGASGSGSLTERMRITSGGDVILQYSKSIAFNSISNQYITADASGLYLGTANLSRLNINTSGVVTITAIGTGTVTATSGVLSAVSDMNLKIEDGFLENALEKVLNLKPRYFLWKEESGLPTDLRQLGFYAQEVNQALGEEVANTPKNENDSWGIYDRGIIAMLTKAIQEQQAQIEELKAKIK